MPRTLSLRALLAALALILSAAPGARADDFRAALARDIVLKTVARNLGAAFRQAEEKTLASVPAEKAGPMRAELDRTFAQERDTLVDQLSKEYAQAFSADELTRLAKIYDDPVYQKFQALNADPTSMVTSITKDAVTRMMNLLALAALSQQPGDAPPPGAPPPPARP
ncbi:hypothetical protein OPKNFCMD_3748 [Methylobacterium crusticola]|uniref:DUF2059 domain-containing protein n=1 Tax=Methylobacterium crusticola TaxID=1697972 RepID=A0ABQ4QZZ5_9HYPH|nr:hypothetical protein [Methylobacterium crusticola]GJD50997.1 hypothetical protein OPKNFCMD_3748 [Methylobacterium crusticola]